VGNESISGEIEHSGRTLKRAERWNLFRSGQFVHNRGFDEIPQLADRVNVLEILDTLTAVFEFGPEWRILPFSPRRLRFCSSYMA
jgi:hypothetical protein